MYKVIIVDDEEIVLNGIMTVFKFEDYGYSIVGAYTSPETALDELKETDPDLIITDIKMLQMNGLEFSGRVKEVRPDTEIVILTGYDEFQFTQSAIKIGVTDYLLKPIKKQKFEEMLVNVTKRLRKKEVVDKSYEILTRAVQNNFDLLKNSFFLELLSGNINQDQCEEEYNTLGLAFQPFDYTLVKFMMKKNSVLGKITDIHEILSATVGRALKGAGYLESFHNDENIYFLLYDARITLEDVRNKLNSAIETVKSEKGLIFSAAVSKLHNGFNGLFIAGMECDTTLLHSFISGQAECLLSTDSDGVLPTELDFPGSRFEELSIAISLCERENALKIIDQFFSSVKGIASADYFYSIALIIMLKLFDIQSKLTPRISLIAVRDVSTNHLKNNYKSVPALREYLAGIVVKLIDEMSKQESAALSSTTSRAVSYVNGHYSENITLADIAGHVYVSKNYLCHIFKKEMNVTLMDYLAKVRVEKAKELLKEKRYKMYQISIMVGYTDYAYFSQLFKKFTGFTLSEFRNRV